MKTGYQVADAMTLNIISVLPTFSLVKCAKIMTANRIGALIVKESEKTLGMLTERDITRKAVAEGKNMTKMVAADIMERNLITINPDADIYEALVKMRDNNIRHLPAMDGKKMVGVLTMKDILKIEPSLFDVIVEKYELREEERKLKVRTQQSEQAIPELEQ